ncbi:hypothetical protein ACFOD0_00985 [Shewanella intestini]|uniref:Uncharacterized protein n=1 Tax=Shewanella intestini TaxID=2017544 RepID=A0ABS5HZC2_9GAMM|nr:MULTISPECIES: hypothetical protein [Shewanella]MBR9727147.1 hypothetical protein [Shewanella intestini]MRG35949.1 hypothetical protein [Shewanella sp. XMDDZSB0408]
MLEISYAIDELTTLMFVKNTHYFCFENKQWITANELKANDVIITRSGNLACVISVTPIDTRRPAPLLVSKLRDVKYSHNHHFFVTKNPNSALDVSCEAAPSDPLELIPYELANRPSYLPSGKPTGHHSGPWVAARYVNQQGEEFIGCGRADNTMCAEDAAITDLKAKLADNTQLNQTNVTISHAYIRKYAKKGRLINTMSPCYHCRENYGAALNDKTMGDSDLTKTGRNFLKPS